MRDIEKDVAEKGGVENAGKDNIVLIGWPGKASLGK